MSGCAPHIPTAHQRPRPVITSALPLLGGGGPLARATPTSDLELDDLAGRDEQRASHVAQRRKAAARQAKIKRLQQEEEDMKFSHSVQFNAVPDWSSHYISYSNLKKLWVLSSQPIATSVDEAVAYTL